MPPCFAAGRSLRRRFAPDAAQKAGKFPVWKEKMELPVSSDDSEIVFDVKDENDVNTSKSMGEARQVLAEWTSKFPGPKLERTLQLFPPGSESKEAKRKPQGELFVTVKYAEKGGGDELQNRLEANAGLGAAVDRMLEEEPESDEEDLLGEKTRKEPDESGSSGLFGGLFGRKEEKKEEEKDDQFAIHKKIIETTAKMRADRQFTTYDDYRNQYLMAQVEKIAPRFDRTKMMQKLLDAKAFADEAKILQEAEMKYYTEDNVERCTRSFAVEPEKHTSKINFDLHETNSS